MAVELVVEELPGVEEQPADEGALAVVHRTDGGEPEEVHVSASQSVVAGRRRAGHGAMA